MNNFKMVGDNILFKLNPKTDDKPKSGLIIPDSVESIASDYVKPSKWGKVLAVGPDTKNIKVDDEVPWIPGYPQPFTYDKVTYFILPEKAITLYR